MPNWCFWTCCGRILPKRISPMRWPNSPAAIAASVPARVEPRARRWADLRLRLASAAVLAPVVLVALWVGGWAWLALVAALTAGSWYEWWRLWRGPQGRIAGVVLIALAAVCVVWLRGDGAAGRANMLFLLAVVWASDSGAYLIGRRLGGPLLWPAISPG